MELRHLRYFIAVAEELHFSRAAERLQIAQPPLSQQIRQLEEELGVQLFHRTKRSVQLTDAGRVFLQEARSILAHTEHSIRITQRVAQGEIGQLAIAFVGSATYNVLPKILKVFRADFPNVELILQELTTFQQVQALHEGRIQIGFVRSPVKDEALTYKVIVQEPLVVALPETHPLANLPLVSVQMLANEPFILFPRHLGSGFYDQIISFCQQNGFSPKVVQEAIQMQTIVSLVAAKIGVALVPASLQNLQRTGVVYKVVQEETPKSEIAMIWQQEERSPILSQFLKVVRQIAHHSGVASNET